MAEIKFQTVAINHTWSKEVFNALNTIARKKGITFQDLVRIIGSEYLENQTIK